MPIDPRAYDGGPFHLRRDADSVTQAKWLQGWVRGYAEDSALAEVAGVELIMPSGEAGVLMACIGRAERMEIPRETAIAAGRAAWRAALARTRQAGEDIRRAVWPLAKMRAPGQEMIAAAASAADRHNIFVPTPLLTDLCRKIAQATTSGHARRR